MRSFILRTSIFDFGIQRVKNCVQNIETYIIYIHIYIFFFNFFKIFYYYSTFGFMGGKKWREKWSFGFKSNQSAIISYQTIEISHSASNHQSVNFQKEKCCEPGHSMNLDFKFQSPAFTDKIKVSFSHCETDIFIFWWNFTCLALV